MGYAIARAALVAAFALVPLAAVAQTAQVGQVTATVTDSTGGALPGATLTLASEERGVTRTAVTDAAGKFVFAQLPLGRYDLTVQLNGFNIVTIKGSLVEAEKNTNLTAALKVGGITDTVTVTGEVPIVDASNQTVQTRMRSEEFEKLPFGRSYQTLIGAAPGVVGTGNVNAHGALTSSNQFLMDGVNTTDPVTGTFGANLNYEAIQEVVIRTSAVSAEFGRSTGAIVDVISKSGTNRFGGSFKYLAANDNWNSQNSTANEVTSASLARVKYDKVNSIYSTTFGGPIVKNRAWFFIAHEQRETTSAQTQLSARPGVTPENFQQTVTEPFFNMRLTAQLTPGQNVWFKVFRSPSTGFVRNDYWGTAATAERYALQSQDQGGTSWAAQYTAVLSPQMTTEVTVAHTGNFIDVVPFERSPLENGAPYFDLNDGRVYNGATFDGFVKRPRTQVMGALNYFKSLWGADHNFKVGIDVQSFNSQAQYAYPGEKFFYGFGFNPSTRAYDQNDSYELYDPAEVSKSTGVQTAIYGRDKFQIGARTSIEAGLRLENQSGKSDIGAVTVDTFSFEPRLSASFALTSDAKTLLVASYGRFHDSIIQGFTDQFANVPQQGNYNTYVWTGTEYVFDNRNESDANTFAPNTDVSPRRMDEFTIGMDKQLSNVLGGSVRFIRRDWSNFVDDTNSIGPDGIRQRAVVNLAEADRKYTGIEFAVEKRLSNKWYASGSYTYSETTGNHFGDDFTVLGDWANEQCRQTVDPGLFGGGLFPCSELYANLQGNATFDRPHLIKFNGAYIQSLGPVDLTAGVVGAATSKTTYTKNRTVSVVSPLTGGNFTTLTNAYFYEPRGSDRVDGLLFNTDFSLEATMKAFDRSRVGVKFDVFNIFNNEEKVNVSNTAWCNSTSTTTCETTVANYGTATARDRFAAPRTFRFTALFRF